MGAGYQVRAISRRVDTHFRKLIRVVSYTEFREALEEAVL